jgi:hypothetical protein
VRSVTYGIGGYDPTKPNNNVIEDIELPDSPQVPLDATGALATLLAVTSTLTVEDAANAVGLEPSALIAEAEAWAAAAQ